jgi:hypothetical protein
MIGATQPSRGAAFWLLLAGVFFEAFSTLRVTGAVTLGDALILASGFAVMVDSARGGTRIWLPWWILLGLPLFAAGPVIDGLVVGKSTRDDVVHALTLIFCIFIIPVVIASQRQDERSPQWLLLAWVSGHAVGAVIAFLQFHDWQPKFLNPWLGWLGNRIAGMNSNPNIMGEALAIVTPMYVALAVESKSWLRAAIWTAICALGFHVSDLTGSRASIGAAAGATLVTVALFALRTRKSQLPQRLMQTLMLAGAVAAFLALRADFYDSAVRRLLGQSPTGELSSWIRGELAEAAMRTFTATPLLGNGYGWLTYKAHNVWLVLLECGGLLGLLGFLITQVGFAAYAWRSFRNSKAGDVPVTWAIGLVGAWSAWLMVSMYQFPILHRHAHILFGLSVLWLLVSERRRRGAEPAPAASAPSHGFRSSWQASK